MVKRGNQLRSIVVFLLLLFACPAVQSADDEVFKYSLGGMVLDDTAYEQLLHKPLSNH